MGRKCREADRLAPQPQLGSDRHDGKIRRACVRGVTCDEEIRRSGRRRRRSCGSFGKLTGEGKGGKGGLSGLLSLIGMGGRGGLVGAILALAAAFVVTQEATIAEARAQE